MSQNIQEPFYVRYKWVLPAILAVVVIGIVLGFVLVSQAKQAAKPTPTPTSTPTPAPTSTPTSTPTAAPSPTKRSTSTPTPTSTPTSTPTPTPSPTPAPTVSGHVLGFVHRTPTRIQYIQHQATIGNSQYQLYLNPYTAVKNTLQSVVRVHQQPVSDSVSNFAKSHANPLCQRSGKAYYRGPGAISRQDL